MQFNASWLAIVVTALTLSNCGRKNNNFFCFDPKNKEVKINRLTFSSVRGLSLTKKNNFVSITWDPIIGAKNLIGYNVYLFSKTSFIPKKPINNQLIKKTSFVFYTIQKEECFVVRAVFKVEKNIIEGPTSKSICSNVTNNLKNPPT